MQIAGLDVIAVDQGEAADAGAGQRGGVETAERAAPGDHRVRSASSASCPRSPIPGNRICRE